MVVRKKILFYLLGVAAILLVALSGPLRFMDDGFISVLGAFMSFSGEELRQSTAMTAFDACTSLWMYTLVPVISSLPSAVYLCEERKSRFYMGIEMRKGRYRYMCSGFCYSAVSGAVTAAGGILLYALMVLCIFPVNPVVDRPYGYVDIAFSSLILYMLKWILYIGLYGMAMSLFASLLVYLYQDLYVDLSALFIVSYLLREKAMAGIFVFPLLLIAAAAALYGSLYRFGRERI